MESRERADCTVRAIAVALSIEYDKAHAIAADGGRDNGRRAKMHKVIDAAKRAGFSLKKLSFQNPRTVRRFIKEYPQGRYIVRKRGHAFAVVDGVPSEAGRENQRITDAWQFTQA